MSNLFCIYLSSDMFLFKATSYAQWSLKIARPGSLDDSVDGHAGEGEGGRWVRGRGAGWQQGSCGAARRLCPQAAAKADGPVPA